MGFKVQTFKGREFKVIRGATHPEYSYFTFEEEERDLRDQFWNVAPGDVVFDVGASYGSYTLTACAMGATVYAFEPEKTVFDDLVRNVDLNGWLTRCFTINAGLWSSRTSVHMGSYAPHWPQQTISGSYAMETLDQVAENKQLKRCDWIKIDVEGAEEHVIQGGLKTIEKFGPRIFVECHVFLDQELKDKIKTLISSVRNYNFEEILRPPCIMLFASPK